MDCTGRCSKTTFCFCREPEFGSHQQQQATHTDLYLQPWDIWCLLQVHTHRQTYVHINNNKSKRVKTTQPCAAWHTESWGSTRKFPGLYQVWLPVFCYYSSFMANTGQLKRPALRQVLEHTFNPSTEEGQRQADLPEFKVSLDNTESSRTARITQTCY